MGVFGKSIWLSKENIQSGYLKTANILVQIVGVNFLLVVRIWVPVCARGICRKVCPGKHTLYHVHEDLLSLSVPLSKSFAIQKTRLKVPTQLFMQLSLPTDCLSEAFRGK